MNSITDVTASIVGSIVIAGFSAMSALAQPIVDSSARRPGELVVVAGPDFAAGSLHRKLLGDNYRDVWTTPIRVPILDLGTFAGGLRPVRVAGGKQTRSLRFVTRDSVEYVFREVFKSRVDLPDDFRGTLVWRIFRDAGSALHPAATAAVVPIMDAIHVLHPHPELVAMPDDPLLGEFRQEFAKVLGTIEKFPSVPRSAPGFAGAVEILGAEALLQAINRDAATRVDARTMLKARLADLLTGDNDRHAGQWRWARFVAGGRLEPISRDRDKVFVSFEGIVFGLMRTAFPFLVRFAPSYPDPMSMFQNTSSFDRRILAGLSRAEWESVIAEIQHEVTDSVILAAIGRMPREYQPLSHDLSVTLSGRRDRLSDAALRYYSELWRVADIHGTDENERAIVTRLADGSVEVTFQRGNDAPWFQRGFDPHVTREVRLYLHGGDDTAVVRGVASRSIPVRIIGGNGKNSLMDLSVVGGARNTTRLYDQGTVNDVIYAPDTTAEHKDYSNALNSYYNRRPWVYAFGHFVPPQRDFGTSTNYFVGLKSGFGLGLVPKIGVARYIHGFRTIPYSSMMSADIAMSTATGGVKATAVYDKRFESSDFHLPGAMEISQLEMIQFRGFGNDVVESRDNFFDLRQTHWQFHPAAGYSFAPQSDFTLGPIVRYTVTDSSANRFISRERPYGFREFAQAGLRLAFHFETRVLPDTMKPRAILDFASTAFPGILDAVTAYETIDGSARGFITMPLPNRPVIAVRAGGKKVFGNFPYFDAAFVGGGDSFRTEHRQRYAGDESLYGSAELRVPIAKVPLILPLDVGALAFSDAARVYLDGDSPGGWHTALGGGFWIGAIDASKNVNVLFTNRSNRRVIVNLGFTY